MSAMMIEADTYANLSAFQRDILWILADKGGLKGVAISDELESYYGEQVTHGQIYPNLDQLVDAGLIKKIPRNRRTNEYQLTEDAHQVLSARQSWQEVDKV